MESNTNTTPNVTTSSVTGSAGSDLSGKLSLVEKVGYGLGDTASNILYQAWSFFLAKFYTDVFGIPAKAASIMFLVTRVWDMFFDPLMGMIADRTNTRWGKFRPYLLWMAIPYGMLACAMFITPEWDSEYQNRLCLCDLYSGHHGIYSREYPLFLLDGRDDTRPAGEDDPVAVSLFLCICRHAVDHHLHLALGKVFRGQSIPSGLQ